MSTPETYALPFLDSSDVEHMCNARCVCVCVWVGGCVCARASYLADLWRYDTKGMVWSAIATNLEEDSPLARSYPVRYTPPHHLAGRQAGR